MQNILNVYFKYVFQLLVFLLPYDTGGNEQLVTSVTNDCMELADQLHLTMHRTIGLLLDYMGGLMGYQANGLGLGSGVRRSDALLSITRWLAAVIETTCESNSGPVC